MSPSSLIPTHWPLSSSLSKWKIKKATRNFPVSRSVPNSSWFISQCSNQINYLFPYYVSGLKPWRQQWSHHKEFYWNIWFQNWKKGLVQEFGQVKKLACKQFQDSFLIALTTLNSQMVLSKCRSRFSLPSDSRDPNTLNLPQCILIQFITIFNIIIWLYFIHFS